jgi:hypothetical protein
MSLTTLTTNTTTALLHYYYSHTSMSLTIPQGTNHPATYHPHLTLTTNPILIQHLTHTYYWLTHTVRSLTVPNYNSYYYPNLSNPPQLVRHPNPIILIQTHPSYRSRQRLRATTTRKRSRVLCRDQHLHLPLPTSTYT